MPNEGGLLGYSKGQFYTLDTINILNKVRKAFRSEINMSTSEGLDMEKISFKLWK